MIVTRFAAGIALLVVSVTGCKSKAPEKEPVRPVRAIKVGDPQEIQGRWYPGIAKAKDAVDLSFRVAGPLITLAVDVGSKVKQGDVIAALDTRDFQAALDNAQGNLAKAQANLSAMEKGARPEEIEQLKAAVSEADALYKQAATEHERNLKLLPTGAVTQSDCDLSLARREKTAAQVKKAKEDLNIGQRGARPEDLAAKRSEIKALEAAVLNARNQLEYATLKAPFDGTVTTRFVDNFQTVQAKQSIVRLVDVSKIEVTIQVPESAISLVPRVKKAICTFDAYAGKKFPGKVTKVGSEASQTTRTYPVTIELDQQGDAQVLPGMAAKVQGQLDDTDKSDKLGLIVPAGAVFTNEAGDQTFVWVVDGGKVARRTVTAGKLTATGIPITAGLNPGDQIVTAGVNSLVEGQEVAVLQEGGR